RNAYESCYSKK
ncbi:3-deoxy-8-phosphooctulonate synthase, partial [Chlamydia psittaci 03DC29]